jgi:hypothetical protein
MKTVPMGAQLREEDLVVGRPWVHPETRLEYEDWHAWFCGKDPIPHWRNARIKEVHAGIFDDQGIQCVSDRAGWRRRRIQFFSVSYERDGQPTVLVRTDEHGLSFSA